MADKIVTGIDVGTFQVKVVITSCPKKDASRTLPQIIGTGFAESRGLRNGYIINESDVVRSVRNAVAQAEKAAGVSVKHAYISMGGIGLDEIRSRGEVITSRADSEITQTDLDKAMQDSEERIIDQIPNRRILHAIPLSYVVDGDPVFGRPHGLKGTKLEVETLFITAFEQHLSDLVGAIEGIGIAVDDVMASPVAGSLVMLTKAQKRAGCVLANIGAETVSIVVFENSTPVSLKVFPIGSSDITNDIALGLKIPLEEAEKVKRGGMTSAAISKRKLDEIVAARLTDIFELIDSHLKKIKRDGLLPAGIIITGGGSGIATIQDLAKASLRLPSKIATLDPAQNGKVKDASWAVAYGLCIWGSSSAEEDTGIITAKKAGGTLLNWLKQFLP
ncbi:cell division protein FtsA [Candidatus Parcubacteria bacterium]|uniref:Cell division protein FtsA n=1 Tax=Candidatus Kaiserbacteria bacterium CG10_big_fil_rev_8_21_14_0_10_47_16 TaxID=1974608 RepID=A0A2H0UD05_9BACT|nr:cell division protein FtsA [Candidatus Parcubacteria bacterium]PIR84289.1 MAG: cell division protein FtsA [Candidatus Kaiserbacteria bacterium CG10_big_fil_rev_8_21_14_0_10_47_16]